MSNKELFGTFVSTIINIEDGSWGDLEQAMPTVITVSNGANPGLKLTIKMVQQHREWTPATDH